MALSRRGNIHAAAVIRSVETSETQACSRIHSVVQAGPGVCRNPEGTIPRKGMGRGRACTLKNYRKARNITAGTAYGGRPSMHADEDHPGGARPLSA
jgi:hypothetical protein